MPWTEMGFCVGGSDATLADWVCTYLWLLGFCWSLPGWHPYKSLVLLECFDLCIPGFALRLIVFG